MGKVLNKGFDGKTFSIEYEEGYKHLAELELDRQIEQYKEKLGSKEMSLNKIMSNLAQKRRESCPFCRSKNTIEKRDRVKVWGLCTRSAVSPYRECKDCGNQFEEPTISQELLEQEAKFLKKEASL